MDLNYHFLLLFLTIPLNMADYCLTDYALTTGLGVEFNPLYRHDLYGRSVWNGYLVASWMLTYHYAGKHGIKWAHRILRITLYAVLLLLSGVVINNITQLLFCMHA